MLVDLFAIEVYLGTGLSAAVMGGGLNVFVRSYILPPFSTLVCFLCMVSVS